MKPEEPEHITGKIGEANDVELPQVSDNVPNRPSFESMSRLERPDFVKAPLQRIKPTVAASLANQAKNLVQASPDKGSKDGIPIGEPCKNGGCKKVSVRFYVKSILAHLERQFDNIQHY